MIEYLTTHDLVWINQTITGKVPSYDYVTLEAAMAGQYSYGESQNVAQQAANRPLDRPKMFRACREGHKPCKLAKLTAKRRPPEISATAADDPEMRTDGGRSADRAPRSSS